MFHHSLPIGLPWLSTGCCQWQHWQHWHWQAVLSSAEGRQHWQQPVLSHGSPMGREWLNINLPPSVLLVSR